MARRRGKKSQNKSTANESVILDETVTTEGETIELETTVDTSLIMPPTPECVEQSATADVAKTDESLPETENNTEKPAETDKMDDDSEPNTETLSTEATTGKSVKLRLKKSEIGSNNFHYTQTYRKANKKSLDPTSTATKQKHPAPAELLADVIVISKSYDSNNTEIEQDSKFRYCFSGILQGTVAFKKFRENYSRQTINQTRQRASFCSGHPYQILTLPDCIWENGYCLMLDYLHGQEIELRKGQFKDFARAVIFFGGAAVQKLREKLPFLARDLEINYVSRVVNELRLLKEKVEEFGVETEQDLEKNADKNECTDESEKVSDKDDIIKAVDGAVDEIIENPIDDVIENPIDETVDGIIDETVDETIVEKIDETADEATDQTENEIVKPDESMDVTDSKELENKPKEPKIADEKSLTRRQTRLLLFLKSENIESNELAASDQLFSQLNRKEFYALNEIAINPLAGDKVPTINEADLNKQVHRKKTSFGTRSSLQGFTFVSQKIKTEPGETNIESIQKSMEDEKLKKVEKKKAHDASRKLKSDKFKVKIADNHETNMVNLTNGKPKTMADKKPDKLADKKSDKKVDKKVETKVVTKTITKYVGGVKQVTTIEEVAETGDFSLSAPPKVDKFEAAKKLVVKKKDAILRKKREEDKKSMSNKKWGNSTSKNTQVNHAGNKRKVIPDTMYRKSENKPYYGDAVTASVNHSQQQQPSFYGGQPQHFSQQQFPQQQFSQNMGLHMPHNMQPNYQNMQNVQAQSWNQFNPQAQPQSSWSSQHMPTPIRQKPVQYQAPNQAPSQAPNQWASAGYANGNAGWSNLSDNNAPPPAKTVRKSWAGW